MKKHAVTATSNTTVRNNLGGNKYGKFIADETRENAFVSNKN